MAGAAGALRRRPDDPVTVASDYLAHLAVERGVAANTLAAYGRDLRRYLAHLEMLSEPALGGGPVQPADRVRDQPDQRVRAGLGVGGGSQCGQVQWLGGGVPTQLAEVAGPAGQRERVRC